MVLPYVVAPHGLFFLMATSFWGSVFILFLIVNHRGGGSINARRPWTVPALPIVAMDNCCGYTVDLCSEGGSSVGDGAALRGGRRSLA